ncbi:UNVERIFIED_CONTAM: hypothetical protein GTU68_062775 [Idotea baltica]|nr:hypothetical protein [Idotea baltica]
MKFLLNDVLGMADIAKLPGFEEASPDMVDAILDEAFRFFGEVLASTNQPADGQGSSLKDGQVITAPALDGIYQQIVEAGWPGLTGDTNYGGQGLPSLLAVAVDEMSQSANMAFSLCPMLTKGVVTALSLYGSDEQKQTYLENLVSGTWAGTMNLTEPQAGSDLAAVRTKAVPCGDHYLLSGQKIFITWGDHDYTDNIIHLVLARTPDAPEGVKGISLFVVPKFLINEDGSSGERNDVSCVGVEHKLGIHASPTCSLSFGDNDGAVGYLVGEENQGLVYMFAMMNEARLAEGTNGIQALDLVGRKLARDKGQSAMELLGELNLVVEDACGAGLTTIADSLASSLAACQEAAQILLNVEDKGDWATPSSAAYNMLMLMGTTVAGGLLVKSAVVATNLNTAGEGNTSFNNNKVITAKFFAQHAMTRNTGYLEAIKAGPEAVMALDIESF